MPQLRARLGVSVAPPCAWRLPPLRRRHPLPRAQGGRLQAPDPVSFRSWRGSALESVVSQNREDWLWR